MHAWLMIVVAYLIGSVSFAVVTSWIFSLPDPRSYGSGNPGATNVLRSGKRLAAVVTLLGDAGKGAFVVCLARELSEQFQWSDATLAGVALAVFLGHLYPVFHRFRGGKGVATAAGIFVALYWPFGLILVLLWVLVFAVSKVSSVSALSAAASAGPIAFFFFGPSITTALVSCIAVLLFWRHRSNISMLLAGRERPVTGVDRKGPMA
jgi:acyl phosphate:glycerol-3-phosphate acyltransferase